MTQKVQVRSEQAKAAVTHQITTGRYRDTNAFAQRIKVASTQPTSSIKIIPNSHLV